MSAEFHTHFARSQHVWLNAAAQAPMPLVAAQAAHEAVQWKLIPGGAPENIQLAVPAALKRALSVWLGGEEKDFGLGTHQVAQAFQIDLTELLAAPSGTQPKRVMSASRVSRGRVGR